MNKWKYEKLSDLCIEIGDGLHGTPKYTDASEIYFINGNNLKNGKIEITGDTKEVTSEELSQNYIPLDKNTLLLSINGTLGSLAFYNNEKVMLGKSCAYMNFKNDINRFYYYYFQLDEIRKFFYNEATGSTIKNLSLKSLQDFQVPVPDKKEWQKIAAVLSVLDAKIELNNRINAELEALAKTIYDYWFVQFDFPHPFIKVTTDKNGRRTELVEVKPYKSSGGKMVYNKELKREIPEGWSDGILSDIANITMGQSPPGDSYNSEGKGKIFFQGSTDFGWRFPEVREFTTSPSRIAQKRDILVSVRAPVGTVNIASEECCIGRGLAALNSKLNSNSYLFAVMLDFKQVFDRKNSVGTTFGSITKDELFSLKVLIPKQEVLTKFQKIVSTFDEQILINHKQIQQLSQLRDWLLPMLMNGQVKVKDAEDIISENISVPKAAEPKLSYRTR